MAGVFLFLPLLARLRFDDMVAHAGYPGSGMVPAPEALLSLLTLKLLDKERRSHITDFDFDEALGLFAGLNVLPKKSYATDYSYRPTRSCQHTLLSRWVAALAPLLFPDAQEFGLDFHPIPHRGLSITGLDHRLGHCIEDQAAEWFRLERGAAGRAGTSSRSRTYSNRSRGWAPKKRSAAVVPSGRRIR